MFKVFVVLLVLVWPPMLFPERGSILKEPITECGAWGAAMLMRRFHSSMAVSSSLSVSIFKVLPWRSMRPSKVFTTTTTTTTTITLHTPNPRCNNTALSFCSNSTEPADLCPQHSSKQSPLIPGLYLVGTPIGNLEDITLRALRVLRSADVILSEDTRHSGKLLQHYNIKTPLLSYHKFNESQREQAVLKRLQQGEIVAQISDAGTPGISDPGMELVKLCVDENIPVIPIPGPSAFVAALSASGLATDEFTFVGFLPKHAGSRKERLIVSAKEVATQIFYVPPHKLHQFIEEASSIFGDCRQCVIAREMTKIHEEFWRGTLEEAKGAFLTRQPKGKITFLIEGKANCVVEAPSESQLENELRELISGGQCLSSAVKLVAGGHSMRRKEIYSLALRKFGKQVDKEN